MIEKRAIVVCGGNMNEYDHFSGYFTKNDYIICVDSGARHLIRMNITPDCIIGDMDSIEKKDFKKFADEGVPFIKYPEQKEETDSELAVRLAVDSGYKEIIILGALGLRFDHSIANIFLLRSILDRGIQGWIIDEKNKVTVIDREIKIKKEQGIKVSLLPLSDTVTGITTEGLYYPLQDAEMIIGPTRGISNEFDFDHCGDFARVSIKTGYMIVFLTSD
jgi:thiamine pyrophosphokinase